MFMKSFMKFLVTLIVVALIGYVVYYVCIINKNNFNELCDNRFSKLSSI